MATKKNSTSLKHYTITLQEDPESGDLVLPFTDEILNELGWREGDTLEWVDNQDGSWSLVKKKTKKNKKTVAKSKTI